MGIKEFFENKASRQKEVKYPLSDLVWVHNMPGDFLNESLPAQNVPFLPNKDSTKFKNLLTGEVISLPIVYKGHNPTEHVLCKSLGLDFDNGRSGVATSDNVLMWALDMGVSSKIAKKYNVYALANDKKFAKGSAQDICLDFCENTRVSESELAQFCNSLQKTRNERNAKRHAQDIVNKQREEEIDNLRNF